MTPEQIALVETYERAHLELRAADESLREAELWKRSSEERLEKSKAALESLIPGDSPELFLGCPSGVTLLIGRGRGVARFEGALQWFVPLASPAAGPGALNPNPGPEVAPTGRQNELDVFAHQSVHACAGERRSAEPPPGAPAMNTKTKTPKTRMRAEVAELRQVLAELNRMRLDALRARYERTTGKTPEGIGRAALIKHLATLPTPERAEPPAPPEGNGATPAATTWARDPRLPAAGTTIERAYKGATHRVEVLERGFRWDGHEWGSLTAIAKVITGQKAINGVAWFGLANGTPTGATEAAPAAPSEAPSPRPASRKRTAKAKRQAQGARRRKGGKRG